MPQAGKRVVRLERDDPFVFGRGMQEVGACVAAGIPVEGIGILLSIPSLIPAGRMPAWYPQHRVNLGLDC